MCVIMCNSVDPSKDHTQLFNVSACNVEKLGGAWGQYAIIP